MMAGTLTGMALLLGLAAAGSGGGGARPPRTALATFAGGCFWCMQPVFDKLDGVVRTTVGYTGGTTARPTYEQVVTGQTGHAEAIEIEYDPARVRYEALLNIFLRNVDPTAKDRQFCDVGTQYRTAIFVHDGMQRASAKNALAAIARHLTIPGPPATEIVPATTFYPAEDYHQEFYLKSPGIYESYAASCGRDQRLRQLYGDK